MYRRPAATAVLTATPRGIEGFRDGRACRCEHHDLERCYDEIAICIPEAGLRRSFSFRARDTRCQQCKCGPSHEKRRASAERGLVPECIE